MQIQKINQISAIRNESNESEENEAENTQMVSCTKGILKCQNDFLIIIKIHQIYKTLKIYEHVSIRIY